MPVDSPKDLLDAAAWGLDGPVELIVTHASWVFRARTQVFKVKRPVNLGFLDFTTLEARRRACEAELALNPRLAPGVYLGLVPIVRGAGGRHRAGRDGEPVDWAVHMVRLDDAQRADALLARGRLAAEDIELIATRLAAFHAAARSDAATAAFGQPDRVAANVEENFRQTAAWIDRFITSAQAEEVARFQRDFLRDRAGLLSARAAAGRVRDGHGDLRLEHVYRQGKAELAVIDCIEFNDRFRYGDVCSDLAFLAMDLAWHERVDLAELLLARYARASNDFDLYGVVDFYQSYRAWVRGKVAGMLAADPHAPPAARAEAGHCARQYFLLALAEARRPLRPPRVIAVGGVIAAGKSTVAEALSIELGVPVVDADRTRKALLGVDPLEPLRDGRWQGAYGPEATERTYAEVLRRAGVVLDARRAVILDASFRSAAWRARARALAQARGLPFTFIECTAPEAVCRARLRERATHGSVSDAREDLYRTFVQCYEPVRELSADEHLVVSTSAPLRSTVRAIAEALERADPPRALERTVG